MQNALREEVRKLQRELDIRDDELAQRQADADHYVAEISALKSQVPMRSCAACVLYCARQPCGFSTREDVTFGVAGVSFTCVR
jgi:hypothetical protein